MMPLAPDHQWAGSMRERTQEEWDVLSSEWGEAQAGLANRVLEHLVELDHEKSVFPLTRLGHSLQVATRVSGKDRKSTRLNSSHTVISYAVFCLKKKKQKERVS